MSSMPKAGSPLSASAWANVVLVAATAVTTSAVWYIATAAAGSPKPNGSQDLIEQWEKKRDQERTGRIRAEVKLRKLLEQQEASRLLGQGAGAVDGAGGALVSAANSTSAATAAAGRSNNRNDAKTFSPKSVFEISKSSPSMSLICIGRIISPYTKRMGTPRQGMLVPSSRGFVQLDCDAVAPETLDGIDQYSHAWIIFRFHKNTSLSSMRNKKSKIRPPRGKGIKVGMLSTRSPHRPNDIGLSLVQVHAWEPSKKRLHIRGLDLVHDTPVYDIKPYVPWDIPPGIYSPQQAEGILQVPDWVERQDDVLPDVIFHDDAYESLRYFVERRNVLSPLYSIPKKKKKKKHDASATAGTAATASGSSALLDAAQTLREILAQDPRSSHKGLSKNQRETVSSSQTTTPPKTQTLSVTNDGNVADVDDGTYRLLFGPLQVEFVVRSDGAEIVKVDLASQEALQSVDVQVGAT